METNIERRNKILKLRLEGKSLKQIANELNCNKSLVAFYCNKKYNLEKAKEREESTKEYENIVCKIVSESQNLNQVCKKLGKRGTNTNRRQIEKIIEKYNLDISHFKTFDFSENKIKKYEDQDVYCENSAYKNTNSIRKRLLKDGIKEYKCERCGRTEWEGEPIPLQVHHINGNNRDNRIENLQILCPNCHALTDTYCGKSKHKKEKVKNERRDTVPSKEDIINSFLLYKNFSKVGEFFNVTDNCIRKWCKKRDLPIKTKEMKDFLKIV